MLLETPCVKEEVVSYLQCQFFPRLIHSSKKNNIKHSSVLTISFLCVVSYSTDSDCVELSMYDFRILLLSPCF
jgi:hypothetical protein